MPIHLNSQILNNKGKPFNLSGWLDGDDGWYSISDLWNRATNHWYTVQEAQGWLSVGQARLVPTVVGAIPLAWKLLVQNDTSSPQIGDWVVHDSDSDDQPLGWVTELLNNRVKVHVHSWSHLNEPTSPTEHHEWWPISNDLVKMYVQAYTPPKPAADKATTPTHAPLMLHDHEGASTCHTVHVVRGKMSSFPTMPECYGWSGKNQTKTIMQYTVRHGRMLTQKHTMDVPTCQPRWEMRYPHLTFKWVDIWANIWHPSIPNKLSAHLWKALHMLGRDDFMCKPSECMACTHEHSRGLLVRGGTHATWQCPYTRRVWRWLARLWSTLTGESMILTDSITLYTGLADTTFPLQWRLLFQATHYHIWLAWCKWAHEKVRYTPMSIQATILTHIKDHLSALHHNANAATDEGKAMGLFTQLWCQPECGMCSVVSGKLVMREGW